MELLRVDKISIFLIKIGKIIDLLHLTNLSFNLIHSKGSIHKLGKIDPRALYKSKMFIEVGKKKESCRQKIEMHH